MTFNKLAHPAQSQAADRTVFILDDDEAVLNSLRFALEIEGFEVRLFRNTGEIFTQSEFPKSGCLVLDFNLPGMDGLNVLAALRKRGVDLPAILITGQQSKVISKRATVAGVLILEKPLLGNALSEAIRGALRPA